jgi:CRISPR/Cas system-associated exonuclease Cas4 (RecB family)
MLQEGQITNLQADAMRQQLELVRKIILRENHDDWFAGEYQIISERDILVPSSKKQRPDRVMIKDTHAIVIDYKFGHIQRKSHLEQVRDYMLLLQQMGYSTEGHIVYSTLQTIHTI